MIHPASVPLTQNTKLKIAIDANTQYSVPSWHQEDLMSSDDNEPIIPHVLTLDWRQPMRSEDDDVMLQPTTPDVQWIKNTDKTTNKMPAYMITGSDVMKRPHSPNTHQTDAMLHKASHSTELNSIRTVSLSWSMHTSTNSNSPPLYSFL